MKIGGRRPSERDERQQQTKWGEYTNHGRSASFGEHVLVGRADEIVIVIVRNFFDCSEQMGNFWRGRVSICDKGGR